MLGPFLLSKIDGEHYFVLGAKLTRSCLPSPPPFLKEKTPHLVMRQAYLVETDQGAHGAVSKNLEEQICL